MRIKIFRHEFLYTAYAGDIAGIGVLNSVKVALCCVICVDLSNKIVKILGVLLSYNNSLEQGKKLRKHIFKIENILKSWGMRQLTLKGIITIIKYLAVSKVIHLLLITKLHNNTIDLFYDIQNNFIWQREKEKLNIVLFAKAMKREA